ncbi:UNVERIFIED_CONTAM: putative DNA helicase MCM9 [Sesamum calycinum]|uniref:Probable DNA helicase MCM9 n=1 Tax=Sesamum calycinum TaxID=2727403 RepID=A0AAW2PLI4_9LAMI
MVVAMDNDDGRGKEMAGFLIKHHLGQLQSIILSSDPRLHYPLHVDFAELMDDNPSLAHLIFSQPTEYLPLFDESAIWAQKVIFEDFKKMVNASVKTYVHVRINICGSPLECPDSKFIQRWKPETPSPDRHSVLPRSVLKSIFLYIIRAQGYRRNTATSFPVLFSAAGEALGLCKDDLVDIVKAGDDVIVTGVLTAKWSSDMKDVRCDLDPVLVANYVRRMNELKSDIDIPEDIIMKFNQFWSDFKDTPLKGRNAILRGICPQVFGLFTVKLAVALTLIGGVQHVDASGTKVRGESHLLLVGDPGTGKSQFLKFSAKLSNRSVITTGLGSTSAGLTVTAIKDGGEWMLEAGALVLADGGLCCIDEFDSMREHDRATIHEAMEQQTISVAKAGLVTTLSTRTIVFGATNPKGQYDPDQPLSVNTTLSGPLLSRFDIVLVLLDTKNPQWDAVVSSHILSEAEQRKGNHDEDLNDIWSLTMLRRYIHFVKGYFKPVLTKEAEKVISSYYQLQRRSATQNAARTTVRMLESLIRLAQAHARLMFRNEVTQLDAITAILCIESSMTTSAIVDSVGNALHSNFTDNPDQEYAKQEKLILEKLSCIDDFPVINITEGSLLLYVCIAKVITSPPSATPL